MVASCAAVCVRWDDGNPCTADRIAPIAVEDWSVPIPVAVVVEDFRATYEFPEGDVSSAFVTTLPEDCEPLGIVYPMAPLYVHLTTAAFVPAVDSSEAHPHLQLVLRNPIDDLGYGDEERDHNGNYVAIVTYYRISDGGGPRSSMTRLRTGDCVAVYAAGVLAYAGCGGGYRWREVDLDAAACALVGVEYEVVVAHLSRQEAYATLEIDERGRVVGAAEVHPWIPGCLLCEDCPVNDTCGTYVCLENGTCGATYANNTPCTVNYGGDGVLACVEAHCEHGACVPTSVDACGVQCTPGNQCDPNGKEEQVIYDKKCTSHVWNEACECVAIPNPDTEGRPCNGVGEGPSRICHDKHCDIGCDSYGASCVPPHDEVPDDEMCIAYMCGNDHHCRARYVADGTPCGLEGGRCVDGHCLVDYCPFEGDSPCRPLYQGGSVVRTRPLAECETTLCGAERVCVIVPAPSGTPCGDGGVCDGVETECTAGCVPGRPCEPPESESCRAMRCGDDLACHDVGPVEDLTSCGDGGLVCLDGACVGDYCAGPGEACPATDAWGPIETGGCYVGVCGADNRCSVVTKDDYASCEISGSTDPAYCYDGRCIRTCAPEGWLGCYMPGGIPPTFSTKCTPCVCLAGECANVTYPTGTRCSDDGTTVGGCMEGVCEV